MSEQGALEISEDGSLTVRLLVVPRSSRDRIDGFTEDGYLKVRVSAPPVGGKANKHLVHFIAKTLKLKKWQVEIISGEKSRYKNISIEGIDPDDLVEIIKQA